MVITVEPGIYIPEEKSGNPHRGCGAGDREWREGDERRAAARSRARSRRRSRGRMRRSRRQIVEYVRAAGRGAGSRRAGELHALGGQIDKDAYDWSCSACTGRRIGTPQSVLLAIDEETP